MKVYDIAASYFILLFYMVITLLFLQYIAKRQTADQDTLSLIESLANIT